MAERERDRDAPRPRRCYYCKSTIVRGVMHMCSSCGLCGALVTLHSVKDHRCEPLDADEREIAADVERQIDADVVHRRSGAQTLGIIK